MFNFTEVQSKFLLVDRDGRKYTEAILALLHKKGYSSANHQYATEEEIAEAVRTTNNGRIGGRTPIVIRWIGLLTLDLLAEISALIPREDHEEVYGIHTYSCQAYKG